MEPRDYNLYHYTKTLETLKLILANGFWPRYSLEDFSWLVPDLFLATPCSCFCDIPLAMSAGHREGYGDYVISFDKDWEGVKHLNPLIYLNDEGPLARNAFEKFKRELTKSGDLETTNDKMFCHPKLLDKDALSEIWHFLPYLKATLGHTLQPRSEENKKTGRMPEYDHTWLTKYLEDEMEWRYVPEKHRDALYSARDYDRRTMSELNKLNDATKDSLLSFEVEEIDSVIAVTKEERTHLVEAFSTLNGKIKLWSEIPVIKEDEL